MHVEILNREHLFTGRALSLRADTVRWPNGKESRLEIVEHVGSVVLVPVDERGRIWFVRQYRHAAGKELLELPAGTLEPGEEPALCAARELREEIGMSAGDLREAGAFFLAPGYATEYMHVFLAKELRKDALTADEDEFLQPAAFTIPQVYSMLETGEFQDAKTIAALALARTACLSL